MNPKLKELLEKYDTKVKEQKAFIEKLEGIGDEKEQAEALVKATELNAELDSLSAQIDTLQKSANLAEQNAAREIKLGRPGGSLQAPHGRHTFLFEGKSAGESVITQAKSGLDVESVGPGLISEKQWKAIKEPGYSLAFYKMITNKAGFSGLDHFDQKLLQEGVDDGGGVLAPEDFLNAVIMKLPTPTRLVSRVASFNTTRDSLRIPRVNYPTDDLYTTGIRATFTGEVPPTNTSSRVTDPIFGSVMVPMYTAMLSEPVTQDLLEDSAVALMPWLTDRFAETIPLLMDNMILNGSGVNQPMGVFTGPGKQDASSNPLPGSIPLVNTGTAGALTADAVVDMAWSIPEQYDENSCWVFNKTNTGRRLSKLKDAEGRYLWGAGLQDSGIMVMPGYKNRELQDYPVVFSGFAPNSMDSSGNGINAATPILFGDLKGYYLVRRIGFSVRVLTELYAELNQVLILGRLRFGGLVAEEWRMRVLQQS